MRRACLLASALLAACAGDEPAVSSSPDRSPAAIVETKPAGRETAGTPWRSDDATLSSVLPRGWTIAAKEPGRVLVNPGLGDTDRLDCLLVVVWGELDASQHGLDALATMDAHDAELRAELKAQQVDLLPPTTPPKRLAVGGHDGAERIYEGKAAGSRVRTWVGTTLQEGWHATVVAVLVSGREERFLPGARSILVEARIAAPRRDEQLARQLAGAEFAGTSSFGEGGAIHVVYRFDESGGVTRTSLVSGSFGIDGTTGAESTRSGRWTSSGSTLRMRFDDGVEDAQLERQGAQVRALAAGKLLCTRR